MLIPKTRQLKKSDILPLPLEECLAKTYQLNSGRKPGVSVLTHCLIVGYVARELIRRMPGWLRTSLFPDGSALIAAAHDVGKISPSFPRVSGGVIIKP